MRIGSNDGRDIRIYSFERKMLREVMQGVKELGRGKEMGVERGLGPYRKLAEGSEHHAV